MKSSTIRQEGSARADGPSGAVRYHRVPAAPEAALAQVLRGPTLPDEPAPGRAVVTRRAIRDIVRAATLGSYGVTGFSGGSVGDVLARLGLATPGLRIANGRSLAIELDLDVAYGVPVAEVARQVDSAIRYRIRQALGREVDSLTIRVAGLVCPPGSLPEAAAPARGKRRSAARSSDLAESGTDVA
jgi:uncharacterized alkaline shock family protein YloU